MKNLKNMIAAIMMMTVLAAGTAFANGGIIISDVSKPAPCTDTKTDSGILISDVIGIIISDLTGIIISDFTGIIISDAAETTTVNCGIIISD